MVNYKENISNRIDIGGFVHILKPGERLIYLDNPTSTSNAYRTFHDATTSADYQVPSGKKFVLFYLKDGLSQATSQALFTTTAADLNTGEVQMISYLALQKLWYLTVESIFIYEVAENLFITHGSTDSFAHHGNIIGYETDA